MPERITTREAAIEEMLRWANGEKSHWNEYCGLMGRASDALPAVVAAVTTESLAADTAEVQKWAAVAGALGLTPRTFQDDANFLRGVAAYLRAATSQTEDLPRALDALAARLDGRP